MDDKTAQNLLEKVVEDYDNIAHEFDKTRKADWKEFSMFTKYIKMSSSLADLGCGNGRFYTFIKKQKNIDYTGIDNSKELIKKAKKTFPDANFKQGNLLKLPIKNETMDIAVSIASLHHIPSKKLRLEAIKEMHRILKTSGILIITVWNLFQPKYKKYIWQSYIKHILSLGKYDKRDTFIPWAKTGINRYYYAFKPKELKKLLEKKFTIIEQIKGNNLVIICKKK